MRARSASLQRGCAGCLLAAAVAISTARCALEQRDADLSTTAGATSLPAERGERVRGAAAPSTPRARDEAEPRAFARGARLPNPPWLREPSSSALRGASASTTPGVRGAPAERGPRVPRRGVGLSHPADVTRGLAAIRRQHGAFLVRADDLAGRRSSVARPADPVDLPRRPTTAPHRELLRRTIGL